MKFLIAASLLCLALTGQVQGGSLRGLHVQVPHQIYGVPETHQKEPTTAAKEKDVTIPSAGAPTATPEVHSVSYVDSLPFEVSVVNFASTTPKPTTPELPYLPPGLPVLPEAPVIPVVREKPVKEVSNEYLPPDPVVPTNPSNVLSEIYGSPSDVYGPPIVPIGPVIPEVQKVVPVITEFSALPEVPQAPVEHEVYGVPDLPLPYVVPITPFVVSPLEHYTPSEVYGPPVVPTVPASSEGEKAVEVPVSTEFPTLPEGPQVPVVRAVYGVPDLPISYVVPITPFVVSPLEQYTPSEVYGPPVVPAVPASSEGEKAVEVPVITGLPALPEVPQAPVVPVEAYTPSEVYGPPLVPTVAASSEGEKAVEVPVITELPALPEGPKVPVVHDVHGVTEVRVAPVVPSTSSDIPSEVYGPPVVPNVERAKPSDAYGPPVTPIEKIPALPEHPEVPQTPIVTAAPKVSEIPLVPEVDVTAAKPSGYYYPHPTAEFKFPKVPELPETLPEAPLPVVHVHPIVVNEPQPIPIFPVHVVPGFVSTHIISSKVPVNEGYHYEQPTIPFPSPAHGVSHSEFAQNLASSLSSSNSNVNEFRQPSLPESDSIAVEAPQAG